MLNMRTTRNGGANRWRPGKRIAIIGGGPGALSAAIALTGEGFDVRVYEKFPSVTDRQGSHVLLSSPVLAIIRSYGIDISDWNHRCEMHFRNNRGRTRAILPFNEDVETKLGIQGWFHGVTRSTIFQQMYDLLSPEVIITNQEFTEYKEEDDSTITAYFKSGLEVTCDVLIGADGLRSKVSAQAFGDSDIFHTGTRVWLGKCPWKEGLPTGVAHLHHSWQYQASWHPMVNDGVRGIQWWAVEASYEGKPGPVTAEERKAHFTNMLQDFCDPIPELLIERTNLEDVYCWEVYNRPSLKKWSKGRAVCIGDAVHPVSPYAAYGMGMAIEDGYFIGKFLKGVDLQDEEQVTKGFEAFEQQRVDYVNGNVEFARGLGTVFHRLPWPVAKVRDLAYDYTPILASNLTKGYLESATKESMALTELHVV